MKPRFFELARRISAKSDHPRCKLGAVIVNKNRVIGIGFNRMRTHPLSPHPFKHLHAEIDATIGIPVEDLLGADIYVYRARLDGSIGLAKPCPTCSGYLSRVGIKHAHFTTYGGYASVRLGR
jgi:tRNA(Arg) A34 adenosine deaminase TadA